MTKNNSNTNIFANIKNWFQSEDQEETKLYKNKVNLTAKKLTDNFPLVQTRFNMIMIAGLESSASIEDTFNVPKQLETIIQQNLLSFLLSDSRRTQENNAGISLKDSLTIKEIYYFSDRAEHDLMKNMPNSKKWFGLATIMYFAGWWLKKYWYTNLFLKKIRNINLKFRQVEKSEVNHRLSMHASETFSNVFNINKNKNNNTNTEAAYDPFIHDVFVSLLVNKVWMRQDTNKLLSKKDIQEIKEHMLKNEDLFSSFNFSSKERKKDFSRFLKTNPYINHVNSAESLKQSSDMLRKRTIDKNINDTTMPDVNNINGPWKSIGDDVIEEEIKKAFPGAKVTVPKKETKKIENLASDWAEKNKGRFKVNLLQEPVKHPKNLDTSNLYPSIPSIYEGKFDIKTPNHNDSIKKELRETATKVAEQQPSKEQILNNLQAQKKNILFELQMVNAGKSTRSIDGLEKHLSEIQKAIKNINSKETEQKPDDAPNTYTHYYPSYPKVEGVDRISQKPARNQFFESLKNVLKEEYPEQHEYEKALEEALKIAHLDSNGESLKPDTSFQDCLDRCKGTDKSE